MLISEIGEKRTILIEVQINTSIILMKNLKNEQKPLYNREKRTILTPSYFRGNRGSYEGSILSVFRGYITVFVSF